MSNEWVWMGHQAHLIVRCEFHLATVVGEKYIVSTVGEYRDGEGSINAIGIDDTELYETYVFEAEESDSCCPYRPKSWEEIEGQRYETAEEARKVHMDMCHKYDKISKGE